MQPTLTLAATSLARKPPLHLSIRNNRLTRHFTAGCQKTAFAAAGLIFTNRTVSIAVPVFPAGCHWLTLVPNRTQRKLLNRNSDLQLKTLDSINEDMIYRLYHDYICKRHADGDMFPPSREQYNSFLTHEAGLTRYFGFSLEDQLVAVAVADQLDHGLSAVYTFYDCNFDRRSLGTWAILRQIELAREMGLDYLYLGYWIAQSPKMAYKSAFQPLEIFRNGQWRTMIAVE